MAGAYQRGSQIPASSGASGAETAAEVLHAAGVRGVSIEPVPGQLTDHYSSGEKVLRLTGRLEIGLPSGSGWGLPYRHEHGTESLPE
jgi:Zn-dependent membrane protease YugP